MPDMGHLKLTDLKRGERFTPDHHGTIVEIVEKIPENARCPDFRGHPGVLIYWDLMDDKKSASSEEIYPHTLPAHVTDKHGVKESLQWYPLLMLQKYEPKAFPEQTPPEES